MIRRLLAGSECITHHVPVGRQFNLSSWTTGDATPYTISASAGVLASSTGSIY